MAKDTITSVMSGKLAPEMLDSVLSKSNINMPFDMDDLGSLTPILITANMGNGMIAKAVLQVSYFP